MGVLTVLCPTYIQECLFTVVCPCTLKRAKGGLTATSKRFKVAVAVPNHVLKVQKEE